MKDSKDLIALFRQISAEVDKRELPELTEKAVISELEIDSLAMMQIIGEMEQRLDVVIPDEDLVELVTVGDLIRVVQRRMV